MNDNGGLWRVPVTEREICEGSAMSHRADPDVVEWLRAELEDGPRNLVDIERAGRACANRADLLRAALTLRVVMRGAAAVRTWQLPEIEP